MGQWLPNVSHSSSFSMGDFNAVILCLFHHCILDVWISDVETMLCFENLDFELEAMIL